MIATQQRLTLKHSTSTRAQYEFWTNPARFRLFVGGVGSGKTRAGSVECLRMPSKSTGMVIAPTYPMLRDATLRTFLELAQKGKILADFSKSEMTVTLIDGKRVLFRSGDDPERLRGPNLGWFYLDEMALMSKDVWLIMIGRLREYPGKAWGTTTPRGFNWVYDTWTNGGPDYAIIKSSTRENPYLPSDFVKSLESSYTSSFARQEIEGDFIESEGAIFKREWFANIVGTVPENLRWVRYYDLAASQKQSADYFASAACALANDGTLYIRDVIRGRWEWPDQKRIIMQTMLNEPKTEHAIEEALHGLAALQELRRERSIANITLRGVKVDKDKVSRALPWAARAESGKVALLRGNWINDFMDEVCSFPNGTHDDMVDSVSGCNQLLAQSSEGIFL